MIVLEGDLGMAFWREEMDVGTEVVGGGFVSLPTDDIFDFVAAKILEIRNIGVDIQNAGEDALPCVAGVEEFVGVATSMFADETIDSFEH